MLTELLLGSALIVTSAVIAAAGWWGLSYLLGHWRDWLSRPPHGPKLMGTLVVAMLWTMVMMTISVWIWALAFVALDVFPTLESSVYFSLVAFTTLGLGDLVPPPGWRILGGLAAANGLLLMGLLSATLIETLRRIHQKQRDWRDRGS